MPSSTLFLIFYHCLSNFFEPVVGAQLSTLFSYATRNRIELLLIQAIDSGNDGIAEARLGPILSLIYFYEPAF